MKKITKYDKLVRDKIPQVSDSKGVTHTNRIVTGQEYLDRLSAKLKEEVEEFAKDNNEEEIADIMEVLRAIIAAHGFSLEHIEKIRKNKFEERGGFGTKLVLEQTEE